MGLDNSFIEKEGLANLRLTLRGTREVVLLPLGELFGGRAPSTASTALGKNAVNQACTSLLHATQEQVKAWGAKLHYATVGPGDVLYVPAGWVVAEAVQPGEDAPALALTRPHVPPLPWGRALRRGRDKERERDE